MAEDPNYSQRYCAFLDILGFRGLIEEVKADPARFAILQSVLERVHSSPGSASSSIETEIRSQSISDAVALSTEINGVALENLFSAIRRLYLDLLVQGFFLRGAIVKGHLYHHKQTIFGEALVKAYNMESEIARFPRVIVAREVREDMLRYAGHAKPGQVYPQMVDLQRSPDGPMFLDVLKPVVDLLTKYENPYGNLKDAELETYKQYKSIRDKIQMRYEETMDTPKHFEKVRWFADYWNNTIPAKLLLRIRGAGLDISPAVWGA
jgi:hypothetical protein